MEPICGGGVVVLAVLVLLALGLAVFGGGLVVLLAKLAAIVDVAARPEERGEADRYTLQQSEVPDDSE